MSTEKFLKIMMYLKEAKSVAAAITLPSDSRPDRQKLHLLGLLDRIQHLVVSLRADFIDLFYFKPSYEESASLPAAAAEKTTAADGADGERRLNVVPFNRRRIQQDRRQIPTFIARDRRSGIADRRRRGQDRSGSAQTRTARS